MIDYLSHISADTTRIVDLAAAGDLGAAVPSCPGWNLAELVWHLTEVQGFWAPIVERLLDSPADVPERVRPDDDTALPAALAAARDRLTAALAAADPTAACWTWSEDHSVAFVLRRQAHEAFIHRIDAELAAEEGSAGAPDLAADGVDEIVTVFMSGVPDWAKFTPSGETIRIEATDAGRHWTLELGRMTGTSPTSGKSYDLLAANLTDTAEVGLTIRGSSVDLDLWLWGRGTPDRLDLAGDRSLADRLRALAAESTQ